jgi:hypothetical protein
MQTIGRPPIWFALCLACLSSCGRPKASAKPNVESAAPASSAAPQSKPLVAPQIVQERPACRALSVSGSATVDGAPLGTTSLLDGAHWLELSAGSTVALRHTLTSREFKLIGPAHALPCRFGSEQILLLDGQLSTSANLGVRPGAEVLIATPQGAVRYGDAALDLELGEKGLRVRVKHGEAWVEPQERGAPHFKNPLRSGAEARLPRAPLPAQSLVDACLSAAQTAEESARRVLSGKVSGADESLGARAAAHMRKRSQARTVCAIAAAAAFAESDPAIRQRLSGAVVRADELWQSVPHAPP